MNPPISPEQSSLQAQKILEKQKTTQNHDDFYDRSPWLQHYAKVIKNTENFTAKMSLAVPHNNLPEMISEASRRYHPQEAFTTCMPNGMYGSLTFGKVDELSDAFAVYLREVAKLKAGTRVAVQMPNCLAMPVVAFGVFKAGCVLVNVNPLYTTREMEHQLNDSGSEAVILLDMFTDKLEAIIQNTSVKHVVVASLAQWFPKVVGQVVKLTLKYWSRLIPAHNLKAIQLNDALQQGIAKKNQDKIDVRNYYLNLKHDDIALLQYTGGTTGVAKGAILTHGSLLSNLEQVKLLAGMNIEEGRECILTALPIYHIFAFCVNLLMFYRLGAHNILVPNPRPIKNCQRAFDNYPISWISGVNTLYNALLNEEWFHVYPPKAMKVAMAGGTALHKSVGERWRKTVNRPIVEGYGLTESSPALCFNLIGYEKDDSIGIPVPGTEVRIVDDNGISVPVGQPGEIIARGPQIMQGYWNRADETAKTIKDGWLYTGDVGYMSEDGYFHIVDRKKDMILVSGFNVYPNEIEDCLARLPQVLESAVIGLPDSKTGERVCAYVVLRADGLTAKDIIQHCKSELAAYKIPRNVYFRDELPKTPVGKVLRKEIRAAAQEELAQQTR